MITTAAATRGVRGALAMVRPLGWLLVVLGVVALVAGLRLGWRELTLLGCAALLAVVLALPFLIGRTRVRVTLSLEPARVVAGGSVAAGIDVVNASGRRMLPTLLELPVGESIHRYGVPSLASGSQHGESFTIRTERRGVIDVGPVLTRRGDALGCFSRDTAWAARQEILVRPPLVPLDALGAGLLRDLEGVSTDALSASDLAFHALREYAPGDDLRHVHWRSSAKASGVSGESQLLVRQYLDTRRSHVTLVVEDRALAWPDGGPEGSAAFETAMSIAASIIIRAVTDDFEATFVCGDAVSSGVDGNLALDAVCRADVGPLGLVGAARQAAQVAPDTSLLFLVAAAGGPGPGEREAGLETLLRASSLFAPEVRRLAVQVGPGLEAGVTEAAGLTVLRLGDKDDLPGLLRWSVT